MSVPAEAAVELEDARSCGDAELIVFQLYHRVVVPEFLKAAGLSLALFYQLRCVVRLNEEHDFSLASLR